MELIFEEMVEQDIPELTRVMTLAFDDDARKHLGQDRGGPEGYDDGEFFRKWLFPREDCRGFKILSESRIIGGIIVFIYASGENILGTIFVDPEFQDKGVGTKAWDFIEATFPDTRSWRLGTPSYAIKNLSFYEKKCGFRKIKETDTAEHPGTSLIYEKKMDGPVTS